MMNTAPGAIEVSEGEGTRCVPGSAIDYVRL